MFDRYDFLDEILRKAGTQRAALDVLGLPGSRGPQLFRRDYPSPRGLSVEEALQLSEAFDVPLAADSLSKDALAEVLRFCLTQPGRRWDGPDAEELAAEIVFGLKLRKSLQSPAK